MIGAVLDREFRCQFADGSHCPPDRDYERGSDEIAQLGQYSFIAGCKDVKVIIEPAHSGMMVDGDNKFILLCNRHMPFPGYSRLGHGAYPGLIPLQY